MAVSSSGSISWASTDKRSKTPILKRLDTYHVDGDAPPRCSYILRHSIETRWFLPDFGCASISWCSDHPWMLKSPESRMKKQSWGPWGYEPSMVTEDSIPTAGGGLTIRYTWQIVSLLLSVPLNSEEYWAFSGPEAWPGVVDLLRYRYKGVRKRTDVGAWPKTRSKLIFHLFGTSDVDRQAWNAGDITCFGMECVRRKMR
jgi:hypothetical protein